MQVIKKTTIRRDVIKNQKKCVTPNYKNYIPKHGGVGM